MKKSTVMGHAWHKENCVCKGQPQKVSARLAARQKETPANGGGSKMFYRKPGSQNRNK